MKTKEEILVAINAIESSFEVDKVIYKNVKIWPIIRSHFHLKKYVKIQEGKKQNKSNLLNLFSNFSAKRASSWRNSKWVSKPDILFFSSTKFYNLENEKNYHRFFDPLIPILQSEGKTYLKLDYSLSSQTTEHNVSNEYESASSDLTLFFSLLKYRLKALFGNKRDFLKPVEKEFNQLGINIDTESIASRVKTILAYKEGFLSILKKIKPKKVLMITYYGKEGMGLTLACKELGIPCSEIQHGQQGDNHLMYANWKNYPSAGYSLIPDKFYTWGEMSRKMIADWAEPHHNVAISGNPVMETKLKEQKQPESIRSEKNRIILALQDVSDFYKSYLPNLILEKDKDCFWYVRCHPGMKKELGDIKAWIKENKLDQVEVELANSLDIFHLFGYANTLCTFWSTVAYEANLFGLNVIITHPNGKDGMKSYINEGVFHYAENRIDFVAALGAEFNKPKNPYMICDNATFVNQLISE